MLGVLGKAANLTVFVAQVVVCARKKGGIRWEYQVSGSQKTRHVWAATITDADGKTMWYWADAPTKLFNPKTVLFALYVNEAPPEEVLVKIDVDTYFNLEGKISTDVIGLTYQSGKHGIVFTG